MASIDAVPSVAPAGRRSTLTRRAAETRADRAALPDHEMGLVLALLRTVRGWNQDDLAKASRVGNSAISDYERGRKIPEFATLKRLLDAMGYPLAAMDLSLVYAKALRTRIYPPWVTGRAAVTTPASCGNSAGDTWEVEQAGQTLGAAVARYATIALQLLRGQGGNRLSEPASPAPAAESTAERLRAER